jgi:hypothetical protein
MADEQAERSKAGSVGCAMAWILFTGVFGSAIYYSIPTSHVHSRRGNCSSNLKQIGLALNSYHDQYHCFPPAYVAGADGKPMHSWRVLLLPFFEDPTLGKLYQQYDFRNRGMVRTTAN